MDELPDGRSARVAALEIASHAMKGAPFDEIVRAAEAFHAFLSPVNEVPESVKAILGNRIDRDEAIREQVRNDAQPPPIPQASVPNLGPDVPGAIRFGTDFDDCVPTRLLSRPTEEVE